MKAIAIIPARYGSTRFPGKVLAAETGKPLIQHVYERAVAASLVDEIFIATDDERIAEAVRKFGGDVVMTRSDHANGTSRIAEAVTILSRDSQHGDTKFDFVVNVQADEPEIDLRLIDLAVDLLRAREDCDVSTIASPFAPDEDPADPNIVKVVLDTRGCAMYFSRAPIPYPREAIGDREAMGNRQWAMADRDKASPAGASISSAIAHSPLPIAPPFKHVGLYVYRPEFLADYAAMSPTPLEQAEHLEQLRFLEHARNVAVAVAEAHHHGIDTPEQYAAFVKRWRSRM